MAKKTLKTTTESYFVKFEHEFDVIVKHFKTLKDTEDYVKFLLCDTDIPDGLEDDYVDSTEVDKSSIEIFKASLLGKPSVSVAIK